MSSSIPSAPGLLQHRPFVLFWLARVCTTAGYQMMALVIGWQLYQLTNSAFDLGLIGLIQFVPAVILTLLIGHVADRYDRRLIIRVAQAAYALAALSITTALVTHAVTPRAFVRRRIPDRLRTRLRGTDRQRAGAGAGSRAAGHPRRRRLGLREPGCRGQRAGAGRTTLCRKPGRGRRALRAVLLHLHYLGQFHRRQGIGRDPRAANPGIGAGRAQIHRHAPPPARRHHARPVRGAARRRHRAAADLCARHPGGGPDRPRPAALGAGGGRADHFDRAFASIRSNGTSGSRCSPWWRSTA